MYDYDPEDEHEMPGWLKGILAFIVGLGIGTLVVMAAIKASQAADVPFPAKAERIQKLVGLYPFTGSGFFWGIATGAETTAASVSGQDTPLQAFGGSIGAGFGYRWADAPNIAFAIDVQGYWNNLGGQSTCQGVTCTVTSNFTAIERVKAIVPLSLISTFIPNLPPLPPITIPGFTAGQNTYGFVGAKEDDVSAAVGLMNGRAWQVSPGFGAGVENQAPNGLVLDVWAGYFNPAGGWAFGGGQNASMGRQYRVGATLWF